MAGLYGMDYHTHGCSTSSGGCRAAGSLLGYWRDSHLCGRFSCTCACHMVEFCHTRCHMRHRSSDKECFVSSIEQNKLLIHTCTFTLHILYTMYVCLHVEYDIMTSGRGRVIEREGRNIYYYNYYRYMRFNRFIFYNQS